MADGSYTGSSDAFNPASYARHFLGSPISWRQGSFGTRFLSNSPSAHFLTSLEHPDFKYPKMSSSIDSDRGSLLNALNVVDREGELCRNYTCCGLHLNDMHALVEHLEEVHFCVYNPNAVNPQAHMHVPYNSQPIHPDHSISATTQVPNQAPSSNDVGSQISSTAAHTYPTPFDPDDMELELDMETTSVPQHRQQPPTEHSSPSSGVPTPPDTPITTPLSAYPANTLPNAHLMPNGQVHSLSLPPSPLSYETNGHVSAAPTAPSTRHSSPSGSSTRPNLNLNLAAFQRSTQFGTNSPTVLSNPEEAFNSYARYASDYSACMPGTQYNSSNDVNDASAIQASWQQQQSSSSNAGQCVPPALLFSTSASTTPLSTPDGSRVPSPSGSRYGITQSSAPATPCRNTPPSSIRSSSRASSAAASTTLSRPASSLLLSKPFKCPKPNCNKSYKQANGLKYHMTHGSCNFAPPKDLEHVKDLLERKRRDREKLSAGAAEDSSSGPLGRSQSLGSIEEGENADTMDTLTSIMSNISESELREVEREAEKRMKPFACGVGDCQRRYKNMNGLRYHYQHSGDHGAVGLALLASGQHECLQGQKRNQHSNAPSPQPSDDKDLKRRTSAHSVGLGSRGSASMPVSRASSRTGTPQPLPQSHYSPPNLNATISVANGLNAMGTAHAQPFTPPQASSQLQAMSSPPMSQAQVQTQQQLAAAYQQQQFAAQLQRQQQQYQQYAQAQVQQTQQLMHAQAMYGGAIDGMS